MSANRDESPFDAEPKPVLRDVVYAPIGGQGLAQQTVRRLAEAIRLGLLREGDRLPPEAQLSELLGISAMTLREALAILREAGLLKTRRGRGGGTFVRNPPDTPSDAELGPRIADGRRFLQDLTDYRKAVTGEAAALAADRATDGNLEVLQKHLTTVAEAKDIHEYLQTDGVFHIYVAEVSRSNRLLTCTTSTEMELNRIAEGLLATLSSPQPLVSTIIREHRSLVNAITEGDADQAREIMRAHADGGLEFLLALLPPKSAPAHSR